MIRTSLNALGAREGCRVLRIDRMDEHRPKLDFDAAQRGRDCFADQIFGGLHDVDLRLLSSIDAHDVRAFIRRRVIDFASLIRSEEHTSELQSLMRISYAVF